MQTQRIILALSAEHPVSQNNRPHSTSTSTSASASAKAKANVDYKDFAAYEKLKTFFPTVTNYRKEHTCTDNDIIRFILLYYESLLFSSYHFVLISA